MNSKVLVLTLGLILTGIAAAVVGIVLLIHKGKEPQYYMCNSAGECILDTSGATNNPGDSTCGGCSKTDAKYYTCNSAGECIFGHLWGH